MTQYVLGDTTVEAADIDSAKQQLRERLNISADAIELLANDSASDTVYLLDTSKIDVNSLPTTDTVSDSVDDISLVTMDITDSETRSVPDDSDIDDGSDDGTTD